MQIIQQVNKLKKTYKDLAEHLLCMICNYFFDIKEIIKLGRSCKNYYNTIRNKREAFKNCTYTLVLIQINQDIKRVVFSSNPNHNLFKYITHLRFRWRRTLWEYFLPLLRELPLLNKIDILCDEQSPVDMTNVYPDDSTLNHNQLNYNYHSLKLSSLSIEPATYSTQCMVNLLTLFPNLSILTLPRLQRANKEQALDKIVFSHLSQTKSLFYLSCEHEFNQRVSSLPVLSALTSIRILRIANIHLPGALLNQIIQLTSLHVLALVNLDIINGSQTIYDGNEFFQGLTNLTQLVYFDFSLTEFPEFARGDVKLNFSYLFNSLKLMNKSVRFLNIPCGEYNDIQEVISLLNSLNNLVGLNLHDGAWDLESMKILFNHLPKTLRFVGFGNKEYSEGFYEECVKPILQNKSKFPYLKYASFNAPNFFTTPHETEIKTDLLLFDNSNLFKYFEKRLMKNNVLNKIRSNSGSDDDNSINIDLVTDLLNESLIDSCESSVTSAWIIESATIDDMAFFNFLNTITITDDFS